MLEACLFMEELQGPDMFVYVWVGVGEACLLEELQGPDLCLRLNRCRRIVFVDVWKDCNT